MHDMIHRIHTINVHLQKSQFTLTVIFTVREKKPVCLTVDFNIELHNEICIKEQIN